MRRHELRLGWQRAHQQIVFDTHRVRGSRGLGFIAKLEATCADDMFKMRFRFFELQNYYHYPPRKQQS